MHVGGERRERGPSQHAHRIALRVERLVPRVLVLLLHEIAEDGLAVRALHNHGFDVGLRWERRAQVHREQPLELEAGRWTRAAEATKGAVIKT